MDGAKYYGRDTKQLMMIEELHRILDGNLKQNESMARRTTFQTGGPAALFLMPETELQLIDCVRYLREQNYPYTVIGRGSNLLVSDGGYQGAIISVSQWLNGIVIDGQTVTAQAGASLKTIAMTAISAGLAGLEFAAGIPGTLGGGICMNAGAYDGELKDYVQSVRVLTQNGEVKEYAAEQMQFAYRSSVLQKDGGIVLSARFHLPLGDSAASTQRVNELNQRRRDKQPLEHPSAGSTFKRPPGQYAGALIEKCGLKGVEIGGAQVSPKHAGFIINTGKATSDDIYRLIRRVKEEVFAQEGVELVPEVHFLGEFSC